MGEESRKFLSSRCVTFFLFKASRQAFYNKTLPTRAILFM